MRLCPETPQRDVASEFCETHRHTIQNLRQNTEDVILKIAWVCAGKYSCATKMKADVNTLCLNYRPKFGQGLCLFFEILSLLLPIGNSNVYIRAYEIKILHLNFLNVKVVTLNLFCISTDAALERRALIICTAVVSTWLPCLLALNLRVFFHMETIP